MRLYRIWINMKTIITHSEKQTIQLGKKLAQAIKSGQIIGLAGELGAGKTQFVKGLAQGFGIKNIITSPTFVLLKFYKIQNSKFPGLAKRSGAGKIQNLAHIDCYRLDKPEELLDLGWDELVNNPNNIIVIEWADKIKSIMPKNTQWINFKTGKKENQRIISFK